MLGDLLPGSRQAATLSGGGAVTGGSATEFKADDEAPVTEEDDDDVVSSLSLDAENRRGEMFKLATLFDTYCCNALKKLIFTQRRRHLNYATTQHI